MSQHSSGKDLVAVPQLDRAPWPKSSLPKASGVLASELRNQIVKSRMPIGADLPSEGDLIVRTGYSRGTVREALRLLEAEGLITTRRGPQGGVRVSRPDASQATRSIAVLLALSDATMEELFHFRIMVESAAAHLAASHASDEQIDRMRQASVDHAEETVDGAVSFHSLIAEACGNEFYRLTLSYVLEIAAWHTPQEGLTSRDLGVARHAHHLIVEHIAAGRGDEAATEMTRHLNTFVDVVRKQGFIDAPIFRHEDWSSQRRL